MTRPVDGATPFECPGCGGTLYATVDPGYFTPQTFWAPAEGEPPLATILRHEPGPYTPLAGGCPLGPDEQAEAVLEQWSEQRAWEEEG